MLDVCGVSKFTRVLIIGEFVPRIIFDLTLKFNCR